MSQNTLFYSTNQSHIGKLHLHVAAFNILFTEFCGHWSLTLYYIQTKKLIGFFLLLLFLLIRYRSGEIMVGKADFYSPPDRLSCKVWETFVNSVTHLVITL